MTIRQATTEDLHQITQLFYQTITAINQMHYDPNQVEAWRAGYANTNRWLAKLDEQIFLVTQNSHELTGFSSINQDGYLDYLFVHKDYQRQGIATQLLKAIEEVAMDLSVIYADVSITARLFFEHNQFVLDYEQVVETSGVKMKNYRMSKRKPVVQAAGHKR